MKTDSQHVGHFLGNLSTALGAVTALLPMHNQHSHKIQEVAGIVSTLAGAFSEGASTRSASTDTGVKVPASDYQEFMKWKQSQKQGGK